MIFDWYHSPRNRNAKRKTADIQNCGFFYDLSVLHRFVFVAGKTFSLHSGFGGDHGRSLPSALFKAA